MALPKLTAIAAIAASMVMVSAKADTPTAAADPRGNELFSPRALGRAGLSTVSDDSGFAILANPAAITRRSQPRFGIAMRFINNDTKIDSGPSNDNRVTKDKSGPTASLGLSYAQGFGKRWVVAIALAQSRQRKRNFDVPTFNGNPADINSRFRTRYGGLSSLARTESLAVGAAIRATEGLAFGLSVIANRHRLTERRSIWAGVPGRDPVASAERDLFLSLSAETPVAVGASAGVLVAPLEFPIEFAAGLVLEQPRTLVGDGRLDQTTDIDSPIGGPAQTATVVRPGSLSLRAGLRYLSDRFALEVGGEYARTWRRGAAANWKFATPLTVEDALSTARGEIGIVPVLTLADSHLSGAASIEVATAEGFLWLTAGYRFTSAIAPSVQRNSVFEPGQKHQLSVGVEAIFSPFTITLGYSRVQWPSVGGEDSVIPIISPLAETNLEVGNASPGTHSNSSDTIGLAIEVGAGG